MESAAISIVDFWPPVRQTAKNTHCRSERKAIAVASVSSSLSAFEISVCLPHAEQQKIAECLTSLDELIAAHGQKLDALKAHKKGLMQQLFPREGETIPASASPNSKTHRNGLVIH